jgi:hypothetical protein
MPPFAQFLRQAQILILKILNVFLWLKFSPSLNIKYGFNWAGKIERFSKVSKSKRKLSDCTRQIIFVTPSEKWVTAFQG